MSFRNTAGLFIQTEVCLEINVSLYMDCYKVEADVNQKEICNVLGMM
jgi:hypothetical protein